MATFSNFYQSFDSDSGKRGKQFEGFVRWFLKNDPYWSTQVDQVWLWDEYPDRWGIDCGVDLVFRHKNGEIWAAQAKCYSPGYDITKSDVDKFLSESNRKGIDKRLLIATTDKIGSNARRVCEDQEKTVVRFLLSNFECADIEYPQSITELHKAKRKDKQKPREHQLEAIAAVTTNFQDTDRGKLIMACGTGKTLTTLWIKEQLTANSTLVLLPSLGLLSQTVHEWTLAASYPFNVLCVCSDQTVGKKGVDELIHSVADLAFEVTSGIEAIRRFLRQETPRVIFSTYQSSPLIAEAQADPSVRAFDLAVADEAHRCAGTVGSDFATILDSNRIRARKRLFATATPRTYSTSVKKAAEDRGVEVVGMDDEAVFGKNLYTLPFGEAIKGKLLTDYRVVIIGVDNPTIADWIQSRELLKTDSGIENDAESLAVQIGLLKAYKDYDLRRVISFHSRVNRAESFSQDIRLVAEWVGKDHKPSGSIKTDFVSGAMPTDSRRRKLAGLKALGTDERGLLTNARCLSEGVDVPSLDGIAFIDPRSSQIDIIQAVGRAIRLSDNKTVGTIVLPVFIEDGDSPIGSIEASNFKPIWDVINALKAHDDVLSAELDEFRRELGRTSGSKVNQQTLSRLTLDLPSSVTQSFGDSLRIYLVERSTESWEYWYGMLTAYVQKEGHARVHLHYKDEAGQALGGWVSHQRECKDSMGARRRRLLEELPSWSWNSNEDKWQEQFDHLNEFSKKNEHCRVPMADKKLHAWVSTQRQATSDIPLARRDLLEGLPGWTWDVFDDKWDKRYLRLLEYATVHETCYLPFGFTDQDGYALQQWVDVQRRRKDKLSSDCVNRLESLPGWSWRSAIDEQWEFGYARLQEYVAVTNSALVPKSFTCDAGFKLGPWVGTQRSNREKLSEEAKIRLERLPNWSWFKLADQWAINYENVQKYAGIHGDSLVPLRYESPEHGKLGNWVRNQRRGRSTMSLERQRLLERLPGWAWDARRPGGE